MQQTKLTRKQIKEALDTTPIEHILHTGAKPALTHKQKTFAQEIAKGSTGAEAYRKAYKTKAKPKVQSQEATKLKANPSIAMEIEAQKLALDWQRYTNAESLRALVIHSLVKVVTSPDANPAQITAAAKVLGTVTEVAAFTERKEITNVTSSEDARNKIMNQLRDMMKQSATDIDVIENDAATLLQELTAPAATPHAPIDGLESHVPLHTIPLEQSQSELDPTPISDSEQSDDDAIFGNTPT